jgi:deazaflavin-dependent oxidoreductase (nitroreductase family)
MDPVGRPHPPVAQRGHPPKVDHVRIMASGDRPDMCRIRRRPSPTRLDQRRVTGVRGGGKQDVGPSGPQSGNRILEPGGELSGQMAGRSLILLTTEGARSGEPRTTVLGYGRDRDRFIVIASDNGAPEDPAWYRNLLANPIGKVEAGAEKFEVRAATAGPEERSSLAATVPWLESQQKLTSREIPVVVLEPVRDHG